MKSEAELLSRYEALVREHCSYFRRVLLTEIERGMTADQMASEIVNMRFVGAIQSDIRAYIVQQASGGNDVESRMSKQAIKTIANALTEPLRSKTYRVLGPMIRRRASSTEWAADSKAYHDAVQEYVGKGIRSYIDGHISMLEQNLLAMGPLVVMWARNSE